jgi:hypothetical protein
MTFGSINGFRQIFRDKVARDNEEAVIGTQLRLGVGGCHTRRLAEAEGR